MFSITILLLRVKNLDIILYEKEIKKWEVLSVEDVSPSKWFPLAKHTVKLPDGKVIDDFFVESHGDVGMVVALTTSKEIILVEQYKHGIGEITLEFPSGRKKGDEDPETTARNELREETGVEISNLEYLGQVYPATTKGTMRVYGYAAFDVELSGDQELDETEDINVLVVPLNQVDSMIKGGQIRQSETVAMWCLFKLHHPDLF